MQVAAAPRGPSPRSSIASRAWDLSGGAAVPGRVFAICEDPPTKAEDIRAQGLGLAAAGDELGAIRHVPTGQ